MLYFKKTTHTDLHKDFSDSLFHLTLLWTTAMDAGSIYFLHGKW